jgi:hypothetical protein
MHEFLGKFFDLFGNRFNPPSPRRGDSGLRWLIFGEWGKYLREGWLPEYFDILKQYGRQWRMAALAWKIQTQRCAGAFCDYGIRWQLDNNAAYKDFESTDFRELLTIEAASFIAIIHTKTHTANGEEKARELMKRIRSVNEELNFTNRPAGLIEIRRTEQDRDHVRFEFVGYDL